VASASQSAKAASIYETAKSNNFTTLIAAVDAADLTGTLSDGGNLTVFAPLDSAFDKLPEGLVEKLLKETWKPQLQDLLKYHVYGGKVRSTDIVDGQEVPMSNREKITLNLSPPRVNMVNIVNPFDVDTDNGLIHSVESVLTPRSYNSTVVDLAVGDENLSTLVDALTAAELVKTLGGAGPFTVFAPTNAAFEALPGDTLTDLLKPENKDKLINILKHHVVAKNVHSTALKNGNVVTLSEDSIVIKIDGTVKINDATVTTPDIIGSNGIVHVIDKVLLPKEDETTEKPSTSSPSKQSEKTEKPSTSPSMSPSKQPEKDKVSEPEKDKDSGATTYGTIVVILAAAVASIAIA